MRSNNKIKLLALFLCGIMSLSFFACDIGGGEETTPETNEVTTEAQTEKPTEETTTAPNETTVIEETSAEETSAEESSSEESSVEETSAEETTIEETTAEETTAEETTAEETTTEEVTTEEEETTYEEVTGDYTNPTGISYAGAKLDEDAFVFTTNNIDESKAVEKTAAEMLALLEKKDGVKAGEVYKVTEPLAFASDKTYYGNLAAIIAEGGVTFKNASGTTVRELIIKGSITFENSAQITLYQVDVKGGNVGIKVDSASSEVMIRGSIVTATDTAIDSKGADISVYQSKLVAKTGIASTGTDFTVQSTIIEAEKTGITSSGRYFIARNNTITISDTKNGIGIEMTSGSYNSMAALNIINDVQTSINVTGAYNCAVELNRTITIKGSNNTHFYVIKNRLGGDIELKNNKYIIADGNTFQKDNRKHNTILQGNTEVNGDNMHDTDARLDYGADEDLLPHTNVDQFTNMEVRTKITDLASSNTQTYSTYVKGESTWNKIVIVPPGVYVTSATTILTSKESNTDIYAYGSKLVLTQTFGGYNLIKIDRGENINISGFTGSVDRSTCGQVHIVATDPDTKTVTAIVSAGFTDGFHYLNSTNPNDCQYNPEFLSKYHPAEDLSDVDAADIYEGSGNIPKDGVTDNGDGTYTIKLNASSVDDFNLTKVGDIFTTRLGFRGQNAIMPNYAKNINFKDLTVFNISNSTTCRVQYSENVTFERYHSSRPRGYEISKETYDKYKAWEEKYDVDLGVYYDEEFGIYRGPDPIWGASSCMEVGQGYTGTKVVSSLLHSTCDDGSNQRGQTGRLAGMVNNGDGTYTVYYKGNVGSVYRSSSYKDYKGTPQTATDVAALEVGNTIVAYTLDGKVLIDDAIVLTEPKIGSPADLHLAHTGTGTKCSECGATVRDGYTYQEMSNSYDPQTGELIFNTKNGSSTVSFKTIIRSVTIDAKYVNEELLDNYDFCLNTDQAEKRVAFDNVSRNSQGVYFDNTLIRDTKSRAILAKAKDVTIKNCTFRNLTLQAIVLGAEEEWAEGTVARNVVIENNVFDNCAATSAYNKKNQSGYDAEPNITPIDIRGLATTKEKLISNATPHAGMVANDFVIRNNKFINTPNKHMICVTGARDVTITGNIFEEREGDGEIIYINCCYNVNVINNKYSDRIEAAFDKGNYNPIADIYNSEKVVVETLKIPEKVTMKP